MTTEIQVVKYADADRSKIEKHYAAYLTKSDDIIIAGPFFNTKYAAKVASDILKGKKSTPKLPLVLCIILFALLIGLLLYFLYREKYDESLVHKASSGQLAKALIIENAPDSPEDLRHFAEIALKNETSR